MTYISKDGPTERITTIDANDIVEKTPAFDIGSRSLITLETLGISGGHTMHAVSLECSVDAVNWYPISGTSLVGLGILGNIQVSARYVRAVVNTVEGAASSIKLTIQAK